MTGEQIAPTRQPPINEIVGLLQRYDPTALENLREQYPKERELLTSGIIMGGKENVSLRVRITTCLTGLVSGIKVCELVIPQARHKLKRANTLRFAGELITVLAGASIFTVLAADFSDVVRYVVAALALLGSLLALAAQYLSGTLHPAAGNLFDHYKELIDCQVEAKRIHQELELWSRTDLDDFSAPDLIKDGNVVCARIMKAVNYAA